MSKIYLNYKFKRCKDGFYVTFIDERLQEIESRVFDNFDAVNSYIVNKNKGKDKIIAEYLDSTRLEDVYNTFVPTLTKGNNRACGKNINPNDKKDIVSATKVQFFNFINSKRVDHNLPIQTRLFRLARQVATKTKTRMRSSVDFFLSTRVLFERIQSTKREVLYKEGRTIDDVEVSKILGITWSDIADAANIPLKEIHANLKGLAAEDPILKTELALNCGIGGFYMQAGTGHTIEELVERIVKHNFKNLSSNQLDKVFNRVANDLKQKFAFSYKRILGALDYKTRSKDSPSAANGFEEVDPGEIDPKLDYEMSAANALESGAEREIDRKKMAAALHKLVAELPKNQQTLLEYTFGLGGADILSQDMIADKLNITIGAVRRLKSKALIALRDKHEKYPILKEYNDEYLINKVKAKRKMSIFA